MIVGPSGEIAMGFIVGTIGTLIGSGGGFLLVPTLLFLYPFLPPAVVSGISLAVVFFNAFSGSLAYARMRRIDYRAGTVFAGAAVPGAVIGAYTVGQIPRQVFEGIFGSLMIAASIYLVITSNTKTEQGQPARAQGRQTAASREGPYSLTLGVVISVAVGFLSSLLGIGGGIIHVPALTHVLNFPVHVATATSHFVLTFTTLMATMVHLRNGTLDGQYVTILWISIGAIVGAQVGAKLSSRMRGSWILRALGAGLGLIGIRILLPLL